MTERGSESAQPTKAEIYIDLSQYLMKEDVYGLIKRMGFKTIKSENKIVSLDGQKTMHFDQVSSKLFGYGPSPPMQISHNFTIVESFDNPNGKFGDNLGNAAIIDCKYIDELIDDKSS